MSIPLKDFRLGITGSIEIWLKSVAEACGTDQAAIAREVLQEWADRKDHEHTVALRLKRANGLLLESDGLMPADDGVRRRVRR